MRLAHAMPSTVSNLWTSLDPRVQPLTSLEDASQELATELHKQFDEPVVLARVFVTVPFGELPPGHKDFVRKLAESAGAASQLKDDTPVLSLIGSHGQVADWNDRRKSKGHVGIPLISSAFVDAVPMSSRLLKELGVPIEWVDSHDSQVIVQPIGSAAGLFFVENAAEATDHKGRKIIAAQAFVSDHKVKSVFGMGGAYPDGRMITIVLFCPDSFARAVAEHFDLTSLFKGRTSSIAVSKEIFAA